MMQTGKSRKEELNNEKVNAKSKSKTDKAKQKKKKERIRYTTHDGHPLTVQQAKFIDFYLETGNGRQSVIEAGYQHKAPHVCAINLLNKSYISGEIAYRLQKLEDEKIASACEILKYFTSVMRGEVQDQFGLEAPLSERTKAAQELAKRQIDIANRVTNGKEVAEVKISLNWEGMENG